MLLRLILAFIAAALLWAPQANAASYRSERVELDLVAQDTAAVPSTETVIALRIRLAPGWHTYWKNAGDAGLPPEWKWSLPPGWSVSDPIWPAPHRMPEGGGTLMTYGWEGEVFLPLRMRLPPGARGPAAIGLKVTVLVCAEICVPETAELSLDLPVGPRGVPNGPVGQAVMRTVREAPGYHAAIRGAAALEGGRLKLAFTGPTLMRADFDGAYFYAEQPGVVRHNAVQRIEHGPDGATFTLEPGREVEGGLKGPVHGVLSTKAGTWRVAAFPGDLPSTARGGGEARPAALAATPAAEAAAETPVSGGLGLPLALLLALAGGLLLNLMPCVFPVLAMKAAALAGHAHDPAEARREGLAFSAGVLSTFLALALGLLALKAAGQAVGWGFQLQSPWTIAALTLVMLGVGLNLSGVFHVGLSLQAAGSMNRLQGMAGAFLTGALAVIVAAPCFAPFMTEAVSFGLTHSALDAVLVFIALGLGFCLPFLLLSLFPAWSRRLPRPGAWMETLKQLLAFPMYAAAAWLAWVFAQQAGSGPLGLLLGSAVLLALAFHLLGRAQVAQAEGRRALVHFTAAGLAVIACGYLAATAASAPPPAASAVPQSPGGLAAEAWSPQRLADLRAEGRPVFVNFTAAWCVTCQVSERAALNGRRTREAFARTGAVYMVADWTRRDEAIAAELAAHGRAGVPLYLVYGVDGSEPAVLPQLLSEGAVVTALEAAAKE